MCWGKLKLLGLQQYTRYHANAFVLTFFSYSMLHATRKSFSNVKTTMSAEWTPALTNSSFGELTPSSLWGQHKFFMSTDEAEKFMGTLDASFMFAYAAGLFVSGFIADRNDLRLVLTVGMASTSITVFLFGSLFEWLHLYSEPAYITLWVMNGLLQSTGLPCVVTVMGNWFGKGNRGLVMGVWSACASVGNILGALLVSSSLGWGYDYAFLITASVLLAMAIINFFGLVTTPEEVGFAMSKDYVDDMSIDIDRPPDSTNANSLELEKVYVSQEKDGSLHDEKHETHITLENGVTGNDINHIHLHKTDSKDHGAANKNVDDKTISMNGSSSLDSNDRHRSSTHSQSEDEKEKPQAINFLTALLLPGVIPYSLCNAFVKLVNYSFFFWLPLPVLILRHARNVRRHAIHLVRPGGIVGGTVAGFMSDRLQARTVVVVPMLVMAVPMLFVYGMLDVSGTFFNNGVLLFVLGCLIGGVANLISAAITADLGRQKALKGNPHALSTVTGILDGTGSAGAALGQVAVPQLQVAFDWRVVFYLFMACTLLTALCLIRIFWQEVKMLSRRFLRR